MHQSLHYISEGRGGSVIYKDEQSSIRFYYEFGGGNCVAFLFLPTSTEWEAATGRPLADRDSILLFVAEQCLKDQVPGGYYKISDDFIELFR